MAFFRLLLLVLFLALMPCGMSFAQEQPALPAWYDENTAKGLRESAASHRAAAEKEQSQAAQYHELEANANKYAEQTTDPVNKKSWQDDAAGHAKSAKQLEDYAAKDLAKAEEEEAKAKAIDAALAKKAEPPPPAPAPQPAKMPDNASSGGAPAESADACHLPFPDMIGMWEFDDSKAGFAIVQKEPDNPDSRELEMHSGKRVWTGTFNSAEGQPADKPRITFRYKPTAEEINPEIPEWARKKIAGQLEWQLEIRVDCGDAVVPYAMFFPGEVSWQEDGSQQVDITGRGDGRRKDLVPDDTVLLDSQADAAIGIQVDNSQDPFLHPAEALIKGQKFRIVVRLPAKMAKEVGDTLNVKVQAPGWFNSDDIELTAGAARPDLPVNYTHADAISIADKGDEPPRKPKFLSLNWIGGVSGSRIDLTANNGETVEFTFKNLSYELPIYNSWVQRGNVRFAEAEGRLRALYENALEDSTYTAAQKSNARKRLRMLDNYRALIGSDKLTDVHRYNLGYLYMGDGITDAGMTGMTEAELTGAGEDPRAYRGGQALNDEDPEFFNPVMQKFLEGLSGEDLSSKSHLAAEGIEWAFPTEEQRVKDTIRTTTKRLRNELLTETYKNMTFGMYQGFVSATGTEDLYLLASGNDAFGRKVEAWQRWQVAIGLVSNLVLHIAGPTAVERFMERYHGRNTSPANRVKRTFHTLGAAEATAVESLEKPHAPKTLSATQAEQTFVMAEEEAATATGGPETCGGVRGADRTISAKEALEILQQPLPEKNAAQAGSQAAAAAAAATPEQARADFLARKYPPSVKIIDPYDRSFKIQNRKLSNCQAKVMEWIVKKRTGFEIGEADMHRMITHLVNEEVSANPGRPRPRPGFGVTYGYHNWMVNKLGEMFGLEAAEIPAKYNSIYKLRNLKSWLKEGWNIKGVLQWKNGGLHAISIEAIAVNDRGFPTHVRFFDPLAAATLELPARDFEKMMLRDPHVGYGAITVFH